MAHVDSHVPGAFCWMELATSDQASAKRFYANLFGWQPADFPMGPDGVYTMFKLEGRDAAACYTNQQPGVPPNWLLYVSCADVNESAAKAKEAGGTVMAGPFDVMTFGKMAVVQDPTGAVFALWQPLSHFGIGVKDQFGAFCWADLMSRDRKRAAEFYRKVFGWKAEAGEKDPSGYLHIQNGNTMIGGFPPCEDLPSSIPPYWLLYFLVENCSAATEKLKQLGGKLLDGPTHLPGTGKFSVVADPQGAVFSLFELEAPGVSEH